MSVMRTFNFEFSVHFTQHELPPGSTTVPMDFRLGRQQTRMSLSVTEFSLRAAFKSTTTRIRAVLKDANCTDIVIWQVLK